MKPGRPGSHAFSHGRVRRRSSFWSLSEAVFVGWISHRGNFFPRTWNDSICFLPLTLTLEDASLRIHSLYSGSLQNWLRWPCWKERHLLLGSMVRCGGTVCSQPSRSRTRCTASAWKSWQAKQNNLGNVWEKSQIIVLIFCMESEGKQDWATWQRSHCRPETGQHRQNLALLRDGATSGPKKPLLLSALPVRKQLRLSQESIRSPIAHFPCWKISVSPAPYSLLLLFNKLNV